MSFNKLTESASHYYHLEEKSTLEILQDINKEDQTIAQAVAQSIDQMAPIIDILVANFEKGGRLFYIGAGTSGRLGILDASEIPPTFGMPHGRVVGLIAG